jgi:transposase
MTRCVQQIERQLSQMNIKIASMTSRIGSKTVIDIVKSIVEGKYNTQDLVPLVHTRVSNRHGIKQVTKALEGIIEEHDIFLLQQIYSDFQHIKQQSEALLEKADQIASKHYKKQMELLQTIPGISKLEMGDNVNCFSTANHLTGWCGLRPKNDESAGRIKNRSVTKGNKYLRRIMVQTAWAASRTKGCYLKEKFENLTVRKSRKKALIAIARKQLVIVWHLLSKEQTYKEPVLNLSKTQIQNKEKYYLSKLKKLRNLDQQKVD